MPEAGAYGMPLTEKQGHTRNVRTTKKAPPGKGSWRDSA